MICHKVKLWSCFCCHHDYLQQQQLTEVSLRANDLHSVVPACLHAQFLSCILRQLSSMCLWLLVSNEFVLFHSGFLPLFAMGPDMPRFFFYFPP